MKTKIFDFFIRQKELLKIFRIDKNVENIPVEIKSFEFESVNKTYIENAGYIESNDEVFFENKKFRYPVFVPTGKQKFNSCIILMHGLNERFWDKYLYWAEYLAISTGKPVILFPIAFHMNRSPSSWSDPRIMRGLVEKRKTVTGENKSLCFANVALSERLSEDPNRFYNSGHQTVLDLTELVRDIKEGKHLLFEPGTQVDFFAYSIGAFISEILFMANPYGLFSTSRLFIFCGGSIFKSMYGESRCIMDKPAYDKIFGYYCFDWLKMLDKNVSSGKLKHDSFLDAFNAMIDPGIFKAERESFFLSQQERISGISLLKDKVMPYSGVEACMGSELAGKCFEVMDFPYEYSHESPFPFNGQADEVSLNKSFLSVFQKAATFLL